MNGHVLDLSKTTIASIIATTIDGACFAALMWFASGTSLDVPGLWAGVAAVAGGITHYCLCAFWVFRRFEHRPKRAIPTYILVSGSAAIGHGLLTQGLCLMVPEGWAWGISKVALFLCWTYPLSRYVVFDPMGQPESSM